MSFLGDLVKGVGGAVGGFLTGGPAGAILGGVGAIATGSGGSNTKVYAPTGTTQVGQVYTFPSTPPLVPVSTQQQLPTPRTYGVNINPPFGGAPGVGITANTPLSQFTLGLGQGVGQGAVQAVTSGGSGSATKMPMSGAIGYVPRVVGTITDKYGRTNPIRRCNAGDVLAKDGACYPKRMVPRSWRAWKPRRHGPIRYREWKALTDSQKARNQAYKVAVVAGLHPRKTPRRK